mgnify:CR=1 FL=1
MVGGEVAWVSLLPAWWGEGAWVAGHSHAAHTGYLLEARCSPAQDVLRHPSHCQGPDTSVPLLWL